MKNKIIVLFLFLFSSQILSQINIYTLEKDLNGDGSKETISFEQTSAGVLLKINSDSLLLYGEMPPVANRELLLQFVDLKRNKKLELRIITLDKIFANKWNLYIVSYEKEYIEEIPFSYPDGNEYKYLKFFSNHFDLNYKNLEIVIKIGSSFFQAKNGETVFLDKYYVFKWNKKIEKLIRTQEILK